MTLEYTVSKEKGSSRYYAHQVGEPGKPIPGTYGTNKKALHAAAQLQGLDYKDYMRLHRKNS